MTSLKNPDRPVFIFLLPVILLLAGISGCRFFPVKFEPVVVEDIFSLEQPNYLSPVDDLNPDATLQLANSVREVFFMVLPSAKRNPIAPRDVLTLFRFAAGNLTAELKDLDMGKPEVTELNGMPAVRSIISGNLKGTRVSYLLVAVKGQRMDYQILGWTLESRFDHYQPDLERMINSFRELEPPS